jgi:hypothetical protein
MSSVVGTSQKTCLIARARPFGYVITLFRQFLTFRNISKLVKLAVAPTQGLNYIGVLRKLIGRTMTVLTINFLNLPTAEVTNFLLVKLGPYWLISEMSKALQQKH